MASTALKYAATVFQPMRALEFIAGHMVYNPAYNQILQMKETIVVLLKMNRLKGNKHS